MAKEVKRHLITKCIMVAVLFGCLGFLLLPKAIMAACSPDSPYISDSSGYFWGTAVVEGVGVSNGDVVKAYADNVTVNNGCVGEYFVDTPGYYGSMSVYTDDATTNEIDGVRNGDIIHFKICSSGIEYNCAQTITWDSAAYSLNVTQLNLTADLTPIAAFSASPTSGCAPLNVQFTNSSTGATSYSWNFDDGSAANTTASPSHSYTAAGTYTVTLTATNASGDSTKTTVITVGLPVAAFSADTTSGCAPLTVNFTNSSTRATSYLWTFGDGSTAVTDLSPLPHQYTSPGTYTVTLTATNNCGNTVETKTNLITVTGPPVAAFTASATNGPASLNVNFTNSSTGATSYSWNFGDGSAANTTTSPSHTYTAAGTYTVTLTATNACGPTIQTKTNLITVTSATTPVPLFDGFGKILLFFSLMISFCWGITKQRKMS